MKQNSIFSYVKRNNSSSEGVHGNEQCSSNAKEAPNPKRTECKSIAKVRKWDHTCLRYGIYLPNSECTVADTFQKCKNNRDIKFLASVITVYLLKCLITKKLIFLQGIGVFKFLLMGVPCQTRKYIRCSTMTKRLKSTVMTSNNQRSIVLAVAYVLSHAAGAAL